jgi:hypothetical protein
MKAMFNDESKLMIIPEDAMERAILMSFWKSPIKLQVGAESHFVPKQNITLLDFMYIGRESEPNG